jgi:diaminohydroxyphosphoribosylaminopyrimidine deaminase/5-amino-6-(5-phosphoribosylamino)uracil reductase
MSESVDRRFMAVAIRLGASANGSTWPNPAVGAIVVKDGVVVGRGRTAPGGRPHGEAVALAMAGGHARGSTIYVSLEPCAHQGRAGPCADAIVAAGVTRVVGPMSDPDPRTAGKGFGRLRGAGIEITSGVLEKEARRAHAAHLWRFAWPLPYVALKLAVSADDAIGRMGERQVKVTGEIARRHVQALRMRFDAILVGRGTIEIDDPQLTVRLPGLEHRSPIRVVLDTECRLAEDRRIFAEGDAPTWVISANQRIPVCDRVERLTSSGSALGGVDPWISLYRLKEKGITRILIEGGANVARRFLESDLVNEMILFRSPRALGGNIVPALAGLPLSTIENSDRFRRVERRRFGPDMMARYERVL